MESQETFRTAVPTMLTLHDGSEWSGTAVQGPDRRLLFVTINEGYEMPAVFAAFSDPNKLTTITAEVKAVFNPNIQSTTVYEEYTNMTDFRIQAGSFVIRLEKSL